MTIEERKEIVQNAAFDAWVSAGKRGSLEIATGVGKTKIGVRAAIEAVKDDPDCKILWAVPKEQLRDNDAPAEFAKWGASELFTKNVVAECHQTVYKWSGEHFKLVVSDEIHNALTEKYGDFYRNNTYEQLMGLSATIPSDKQLIIMGVAPICYTYSLQEALEDGVVSPFDIVVVNHVLNSTKKTIQAGPAKAPYFVTEAYMYQALCKEVQRAFFTKNSNYIQAAQFKRMRFLFNLPSKIEPTARLLESLKKEKTILFGNSTTALDQLTPYAVHSNKDKKENVEILRMYSEGEINLIASAEMLKEGVNLAGLQRLVMLSYNSSSKDFVQKIGRAVRFEEDKLAKAYIFKTMNTKEDDWFLKMTQDIDLSNVTHISSNQL
jgi:superfamily II DNA or RNA helicase